MWMRHTCAIRFWHAAARGAEGWAHHPEVGEWGSLAGPEDGIVSNRVGSVRISYNRVKSGWNRVEYCEIGYGVVWNMIECGGIGWNGVEPDGIVWNRMR